MPKIGRDNRIRTYLTNLFKTTTINSYIKTYALIKKWSEWGESNTLFPVPKTGGQPMSHTPRIKMKIKNLPLIDISKYFNNNEVRKALGLPDNGTSQRLVKEYIEIHKLDNSHFDNKRRSQEKYLTIIKKCPVCDKEFSTKKGHKNEKQTCSYSCSNTFFRSKENNPNWKNSSDNHERQYREICFKTHKKQCVICGEENIVAVHHMDENHYNNDPSNLVPLCPTHHQYMHSKYKHLVIDKILEFLSAPKANTLPN